MEFAAAAFLHDLEQNAGDTIFLPALSIANSNSDG